MLLLQVEIFNCVESKDFDKPNIQFIHYDIQGNTPQAQQPLYVGHIGLFGGHPFHRPVQPL